MAITDELREYAEEQIKWLDMTKVHYRKLFAIADRIDAEHEAMLIDARKTVYEGSHAKQWTPNVISGPFGWCELTGRSVGKLDSPNNQCSHVGIECEYKEAE